MREVLKSRVRVGSYVDGFGKNREGHTVTRRSAKQNSGLNAIADQSRLRNPGEFSAAATIVG